MGEVCFVDELWWVQHSPHVAAGFVEWRESWKQFHPKLRIRQLVALYPPRSEKMERKTPSELATSWRSAFTSWMMAPHFLWGWPSATKLQPQEFFGGSSQKQRLWHVFCSSTGVGCGVRKDQQNWPWAPEHPRHGHFGAKPDLLFGWLGRWCCWRHAISVTTAPNLSQVARKPPAGWFKILHQESTAN